MTDTKEYKFIDKNSEVDEDGEHADLGVHETSRITGANSYNDNYQLVNYTSELRDDKDRFYAFVDFNENDEGRIRECPHCLEYEIHNKLKPRILKKDEVKPPDYDQFIQCWECGNIYPIYQAYPETEIKDSEHTVSNPFESNQSIFMSSKKRKYKDRLNNKYYDDDPEIEAELNKGNAVKILYDSSN